jgi:nucleoid DNA-binding protein
MQKARAQPPLALGARCGKEPARWNRQNYFVIGAQIKTMRSNEQMQRERSIHAPPSSHQVFVGITKKNAKLALDELNTLVVRELKKEGSIRLAGLGIFRKRKLAGRVGRNPATGE